MARRSTRNARGAPAGGDGGPAAPRALRASARVRKPAGPAPPAARKARRAPQARARPDGGKGGGCAADAGGGAPAGAEGPAGTEATASQATQLTELDPAELLSDGESPELEAAPGLEEPAEPSAEEEEEAEEEEVEEEDYEAQRSRRVARNRAKIQELGLDRMARAVRAPPKTAAKKAGPRRKRAAAEGPARRSGRERKQAKVFGNVKSWDVADRDMRAAEGPTQTSSRLAAAQRRLEALLEAGGAPPAAGPSKPDSRGKGGRRKKVPKEDITQKPCLPLTAAKARWAQKEMELAFADEIGMDWTDAKPRKVDLAGDALTMSNLMKAYKEYTAVPAVVKKKPAVNSSYKSASSHFGDTPGIDVGQLFISRVQSSKAGIHGPWVGGIAGSEKVGCYSIVLSGGYEGDRDDGVVFTYTGSGGRDLSGNKRTAPQTSDQLLCHFNKALAVNMWRGLPLRVVRGYKGKGEFAPAQGYRYDGLYDVTEVWPQNGPSGHVIWRYRMKRRDGQAPPVWDTPDYKTKECALLELMLKENGEKSLIPVGTGTLGLYRGPRDKEGNPVA